MCDECTTGFMMEKKYWVMVELRYPSFRSGLCELYEEAWKFKTFHGIEQLFTNSFNSILKRKWYHCTPNHILDTFVSFQQLSTVQKAI
jgi:hypothetical protein